MASVLEESPYGSSISTSVFLITSDGKTLQLPIPSSSPKDPLNWHPAKRRIVLGNVFFFAMLAVVQLQSLGVLVPVMAIDYLPQVSFFNLKVPNIFPDLAGHLNPGIYTNGIKFTLMRRPISVHLEPFVSGNRKTSSILARKSFVGCGIYLRRSFAELLPSCCSAEHAISCLGFYILCCKYRFSVETSIAYLCSLA